MSEALRILLITGEYPPMEGGVADFSAIIGRCMAAQGAIVHVLTSSAAREGVADGVTVHPWQTRWSAGALLSGVRKARSAFAPHIVNIQYQTAAYAMQPAINLLPSWLPSLRAVTTFHDLRTPYLFPKAGRLRQLVNLRLAQSSRAVIVTNAEDLAALRTWRGIRRTALIPIGSNITPAPVVERAAWRVAHRFPADALVLCYFGFLNASKGGEELVAALDSLVRVRRDVRLVMIGGAVGASDATNISYLARVRQEIVNRRLGDRVLWTGYLDQSGVSDAFGAADICVLPYRDGISFRRGSLMAALAHGMPIISTLPAVPLGELAHGENVWLTPPGDAASLAEAIARVADDPALRRRLAEGARLLARRFDWDEIATQTLALFRQVLDEPARGPSCG